MTETKAITISAEITPNPNTLKFKVNKTLVETGAYDFPAKEFSESSILASELFAIDGVSGILISKDFVSVSKRVNIDWTDLVEPVTQTIKLIVGDNEHIIDPEYLTEHTGESDDSETVKKIKEILENEIKPAVAMDGGDVNFSKFEDGIVYLALQGACSTCPSATMTLKMGIEARLKEECPDIEEVVQI
ncbi:NifU family protein [bacterium]|jgi:NFU1 iron-sulfur cluster scaffold homolog, mitochondrial|nr:NifU family protein [bacterium]